MKQIQVTCNRCHQPMTIEHDDSIISEKFVRLTAICDRCTYSRTKIASTIKEPKPYNLPYKD